MNTTNPPEDGLLNRNEAFKMARSFLTLPLHLKIEIAKKHDLWVQGEVMLSDVELCKAIFNRAKEQKKISALQATINEYERNNTSVS